MAYIQVNDISKNYKTVKALQSISFEIARNEFFGLIGPDGAGKTSLLRIMSSLILPDSGSVLMGELCPVKDFRQLRKKLGYMPGRFSLYQDLTVEENLKFFATVFGTSIEENYDLIKDIYVQIEPFKKRRAGKLSGGMKQKLALCCALIHKPEILILDEPTTGVDAVSRKEFWEMLKRLQEHELTIIVSTPYMDDAEKCDRVGLMQNGKLLAVGTTSEIVAEYKYPVFSVKAPNPYRCMEHLKLMPNIVSAYAFGKEIHVSAKDHSTSKNDINDYLISLGYNSFSVENITAQIEDVFLQLMTK